MTSKASGDGLEKITYGRHRDNAAISPPRTSTTDLLFADPLTTNAAATCI
jgi:hypothetical protein